MNHNSKNSGSNFPPSNREAEIGLIGSLMRDDQYARIAMAEIREEHFYDLSLRALYAQLVVVFARDGSVSDHFIQTAHLWSVEEIRLMDICLDSVFNAIHTERYMRLLEESLADRKAWEKGRALIEAAQAGTGADALGIETVPEQDPMAHLDDDVQAEGTGKRSTVEWTRQTWLSMVQALKPGSITLMCGSPGASKSLWILEHVWRWTLAGVKCSILELEKGRHFHLRRAIAQMAEQPGFTSDLWVRRNFEAAQRILAEQMDRGQQIAPSIQAMSMNQKITVLALLAWIEREASTGSRILVIDPVSLMETSNRPWDDHREFTSKAGRLCAKYGCSLICITHPRDSQGGRTVPALGNISGGKAWERFTDTVLWLESHEAISKSVDVHQLVEEREVNRTIHVLKARMGPGSGWRIGLRFDAKNLWHHEQGKVQE